MDQHTLTSYRFARSRADLVLAPGERIVAGGTWFFGEPQIDTTGVVDITTMGWPDIEWLPDGGLRIAATCTIETLAALPARDGLTAHPLFAQCATALLASYKIWHVATVGGNICRSYAAASMVSLAATLDADAVIWRPDGGERRTPVADLVSGNGTNTLDGGEILRAIEITGRALACRTAFRKIALTDLGRSGAVVTGRRDVDGATSVVVTAATGRPRILRYPDLPEATRIRRDVLALGDFYTDPLGSADWRRGVSATLAEQVAGELAA